MTLKILMGWLILVVILPSRSHGSFEPAPGGARLPGMGNAGVAVLTGPEGLFANPASLTGLESPAFTFFFRKPYNLDVTHGVVSAVLPTRIGWFGIGAQSFGQPLYRETTLALGWGVRIGDRLSCGAVLRACRLTIRGYGAATAFQVDAGCIVRLNDRTRWGFAIGNITQTRLGRHRENLPQSLRMGLAVEPAENVLIAVEIDKDTRYPLRIKGGCEIALHRLLRLRCGFGTEPSEVTAGLGLMIRAVGLDYACVLHPLLGVTHHASVTLGFRNRPERPGGT